MSNLSIAIPSFDVDGFMWELDDWDEATARQIARMDARLPPGRFGPDCMTRLFPDAREAWRIAGLPNPGEEAKTYL